MTGILWDEINIVERGHNYGWAAASKSGQSGIALSAPGMDDPIVYYTPTFAPAGIAFYTGSRYPGWKNTSACSSAACSARRSAGWRSTAAPS